MQNGDFFAEQFEQNRGHLLAVGYRLLGSVSEAEDAVQEAWLRLERTNSEAIDDLRAWLTTVVARVCLDGLRSRRSRREYSPEDWRPEPIVAGGPDGNPEEEAELAEGVGLALLVVLETLTPAERLAFVLHDVFGIQFDEIAAIIGRSPVAARQLASRARRRVQGSARVPEGNLAHQRRVVDAFLAASRSGSFEGLLAILAPDVEFRSDRGPSGRQVPTVLRGSTVVARHILARGAPLAHLATPAIVNGAAGALVGTEQRLLAVVGFTVNGERIVAIDLNTDPARVRHLPARLRDVSPSE
jgi:RNA polymerase sigma factor (sigma-70 family)